MNCMAIEADGQIVVIDCGIGFTQSNHLPPIMCADFEWLLQRQDAVQGVVITHGHEDHIGALPHLLAQLPVPVFIPEYAMALVEERLRDHPGIKADLRPNDLGDKLKLGPFVFERFAVHHSIPRSTGLIIETKAGTIVHSGDFKIEDNPVEHQNFDSERLAEAAASGVRLLLSDSTNATVEGRSGDEQGVRDALSKEIENAEHTVVVAIFASNVFRLAHVLNEAKRLDKRVCFIGRSVIKHARIAEELGLIPSPQALLVSRKEAKKLPREKLLVIATGTQGEDRAALARLARQEDAHLELRPDDTVVFSSRVIPGNEMSVFSLHAKLQRLGVRIVDSDSNAGIHVSGHATRDELKTLIDLVQPECFMPVHGTYVHLKAHAELATNAGVGSVLQIENGDVAELTSTEFAISEHVETGKQYVDGTQIVEAELLSDRKAMLNTSAVFVVLKSDESQPTQPHIVRCRSVLAPNDHGNLEKTLSKVIRDALQSRDRDAERTEEDTARRSVMKHFSRKRMRVPMIDVMTTDKA